MGNAVALLGLVGVVIGVIALIRGRLLSARIRSRKVAAATIAGSVVALILGAGIAAPAQPPAAAPAAGPQLSASSTERSLSTGPALQPARTPQQTPTAATPLAPSSATARVPSPVARSTVAVTAVAADVQQAGPRRAISVLASLPVRGRAPMTGYSRAQFGEAWTDDNDDQWGHNGCDTRNDILGRDLTTVLFKLGTKNCAVATGMLSDPYTGKEMSFSRSSSTVQIDHVVALGDAWQTGAQNLSAQLRVDLANDALELLAVAGPANEAKGDADAATWLPPNKAYRCAYVARQVAVKARYRLWVTAAEHDAITRVLSRCTTQTAPAATTALPIEISSAAIPTRQSTPPLPTSVPSPATTLAPTSPVQQLAPAIPPVKATLTATTTPQPAPTGTADSAAAPGPTARCRDGWLSYAAHHQGACSHHGGVATFYR